MLLSPQVCVPVRASSLYFCVFFLYIDIDTVMWLYVFLLYLVIISVTCVSSILEFSHVWRTL